MLKEACAENFTEVPGFIERGAERIELCDNLAVGGTTPSVGVIQMTTAYCSGKNVSVIVILRPRGGDFVYSVAEKAIMLRDLEEIIASHANGIAVGALTAADDLDKPFLEEIAKMASASGTELAFHMAFDEIPEEKQRDALLWLGEIGFTRILTHGGPTESTIFDNAKHIAELAEISPKMTIMPGGGITKDNLTDLEKVLGFTEVHGTRIV